MNVENRKKIELAKEVFIHLYEIAKEYRSIIEKQEQEIKDKTEKIENLQKEIQELKKEKYTDLSKNIDMFLDKMSEDKKTEIIEKDRMINDYLKNIVNTMGKLEKSIDEFPKVISGLDMYIDKKTEMMIHTISEIIEPKSKKKSKEKAEKTDSEDKLKSDTGNFGGYSADQAREGEPTQ